MLGDGCENGAKVDRSENNSEDVIAKSEGKSIVRNNSPVSGLCHRRDTGTRCWYGGILIRRIFMGCGGQ